MCDEATLASLKEELVEVKAARRELMTTGMVKSARSGRYGTWMEYGTMTLADYNQHIQTLERQIEACAAELTGTPRARGFNILWG
jgi:hypothetical protein